MAHVTVVCSVCGTELEVCSTFEGDVVTSVMVKPCEECLEEACKKEHQAGWDENNYFS
jgi:hypothetical protein